MIKIRTGSGGEFTKKQLISSAIKTAKETGGDRGMDASRNSYQREK